MAIYQMYIGLIPESGLEEDQPTSDQRIETSTASGYFETNQDEYWRRAKIVHHSITKELDSILERATWGNEEDSNNWKTENQIVDHDAYMHFDPVTGYIESLSMRVDMRKFGVRLVPKVLEIATNHELMISGRNGVLYSPTKVDFWKMCEGTSTMKFLTEPREFLEEIKSSPNKKIFKIK